MASPPEIGAEAPDFALEAAGGGEVALRSYRGVKPVVLLFYPGAFTGVCTKEMCDFRDASTRTLRGLDAELLGISPDPPAKLVEFASAYGLPMRLLSDPSKAVFKRYGALGLFGLVPKRATFVVDKGGVVRYAKVQLPLFRPDPEKVAAALRSLSWFIR